jgi:hypothetical protein
MPLRLSMLYDVALLVGGLCFVMIGSMESTQYRSTKELYWLAQAILSFVAGAIMLASAAIGFFR